MLMVETDLVQAVDNSAKIDSTTDIYLAMLSNSKMGKIFKLHIKQSFHKNRCNCFYASLSTQRAS